MRRALFDVNRVAEDPASLSPQEREINLHAIYARLGGDVGDGLALNRLDDFAILEQVSEIVNEVSRVRVIERGITKQRAVVSKRP